MIDSFTFYKNSKVHIAFKSVIDVFSTVHVVEEYEITSSPYVPKELLPQTLIILTLSSSSEVMYNLRTIYENLNEIL